MENFLQPVKDQYEAYPYPERNPQDELKMLWSTYGCNLLEMNYYCFGGKETFQNGFRVLDAGGGTGDSTIFLAEQLRDMKGAEVVYADISTASMNIAKERARIRGLTNITFIQKSILDFPKTKNMGHFDYITCSGVLHHLEDSDAGLAALKSVLKDKGAMGLMVYGKYGRTGIYQMQDLMRLVNGNEQSMSQKIKNAKGVVESLPASNWFKMSENLAPDHKTFGDIGYYDLFLHSHDRCFDIPGLYTWIEKQGMHLTEFAITEWRNMLDPEMFIKDQSLLSIVKSYDIKKQRAIMEILVGNIFKHTVYASRLEKPQASLGDLDMVPFFHNISPTGVYEFMEKNPGRQIIFTHKNGHKIAINPQMYTKMIFKYLDGNRTLYEIFSQIRQDLKDDQIKDEKLMNDFKSMFEIFIKLDWMLIRHKSVPAMIGLAEMQSRMLKLIAEAA